VEIALLPRSREMAPCSPSVGHGQPENFDADEFGALELSGSAKEKVKLDRSGVIFCDVVEGEVDSGTANQFPVLK
jgi:hypothetical protein